MRAIKLNEIDAVQIITIQDNCVDMTATDNNEIVRRAGTRANGKIHKSVLAEHGFSAVVRTTNGGLTRTMLFDFGFSDFGAAYNAEAVGAPLEEVEAIALSHGHRDHFGGFRKLTARIGKQGIEFVVHPGVFNASRYLKFNEDARIRMPAFTRETAKEAGANVVETKEPRLMLGGDVLFLGEIPRRTDFEMGMPNAYFEKDGVETRDVIEEDTSLVMHLKGKGLIVLSGCAHSGIVNTVAYAREATGVDVVHVIMGGFHLGGPFFEPFVGRTIDELLKVNPRYIVPTHCTGRKTIQQIEAAMPQSFILNMSGTRLTFAA